MTEATRGSNDDDAFPEVEFWGEALVPWPRSVVAHMGLPDADASYLADIGLPVGIDWNLEVSPPSPGAPLRTSAGRPVLAFDGPTPICVDPDSRAIVAIEAGPRIRLVSSNVRRFGAFLMIYQRYRLAVRGLDDAAAERLVEDVESMMRTTDPDAMKDPEAYWPMLIQQMREGHI